MKKLERKRAKLYRRELAAILKMRDHAGFAMVEGAVAGAMRPRADGAGAAERRTTAVADRFVSFNQGPDGTGTLYAQHDGLVMKAMKDRLTAIASTADPDDPRSQGQRVADSLAAAILGPGALRPTIDRQTSLVFGVDGSFSVDPEEAARVDVALDQIHHQMEQGPDVNGKRARTLQTPPPTQTPHQMESRNNAERRRHLDLPNRAELLHQTPTRRLTTGALGRDHRFSSVLPRAAAEPRRERQRTRSAALHAWLGTARLDAVELRLPTADHEVPADASHQRDL